MRVRSLHLQSSPGLPNGLRPLELADGLVLVVGPNASGKSTLANSVRALAWPELGPRLQVSARCEVQGKDRDVLLHAGRANWSPLLDDQFPRSAQHLTRFGLRSLLAASEKGDLELAQQLFQELAGGLDLDAARAKFSAKEQLHPGSKLARWLETARKALDAARSRAREHSAEEERQAELEESLARAREAKKRAESGRLLIELAGAAAHLRQLEHQDSTFADGLDRIPEDLKEQLGAGVEKVASTQRGLDAARAEVERLEGACADSRLDKGGLEQLRTDLHAWEERLGALADGERELEKLVREEASSAERLREAEEKIDPGAATASRPLELDAQKLEALVRAVGDVREAQAGVRELEQRLEPLERALEGAGEAADRNELAVAADALRGWLRSPGDARPAAGGAPRGVALLLIAAGIAALLLAFALGQPWISAGLGLAGLGVGLLMGTGSRTPEAAGGARDDRRASLESSPLAPEAWDEPSVLRQLQALEKQLADAAELENTRAARDTTAGDLERKRGELQEREARRDAALAEAGVGGELAELGAVHQAQRLQQWLDESAAVAGHRGKLQVLQRRQSEELGQFESWLGGHLPDVSEPDPSEQGASEQVASEQAIADVAAARAAVRSLRDHCERLHTLMKDLEQARRDLERAQNDHADAEEAVSGAWKLSGVEPGDHGALDRRMEQRQAWLEHARSIDQARMKLESARQAYSEGEPLDGLSGAAAEGCSTDELEGRVRADEQEAAQLEVLIGQQGEIKGRLDEATRGQDLGDALARVAAAEQDVQDERARAASDRLARMLLEDARPSLEGEEVPRTLEGARRRFLQFTHGSWQIELDREYGFRARDMVLDRERSLKELSDGTRAQLLLAARLAALEAGEGPLGPLPLCLDEALSTTDPARFEAIAEALFTEVDAGRQVLYFTADPGEVEQWLGICDRLGRPRPRVVDLGQSADEGADWGQRVPSAPPERAPLPDPALHDADSYARAIGVPLPDGLQPATSWHLWLVLRDDLAALHQCLQRRISTIGTWESTRGAGRHSLGLDEAVVGRADALAELSRALSEAWRVGRGRPVTWEDVEASEAVTPTFEDETRRLLLEHGRDPAAYLAAVRSLPRFQKKKGEVLEAYLESVGCLPTREPLARDELVRRALLSCPEAVELLGSQAAGHVEWLIELLVQADASQGESQEATPAS